MSVVSELYNNLQVSIIIMLYAQRFVEISLACYAILLTIVITAT